MDAQGWAILLAVFGSPAIGVILTKYFRPNATPMDMIQELQEERTNDAARLERVEASQRILLDYVHELRQHIADGKPPPPPKWPGGMQV